MDAMKAKEKEMAAKASNSISKRKERRLFIVQMYRLVY